MTDLSRRTLLACATLFGVVSPLAASRAADARGGEKRVALNGHDPVSYFNPGHPEKGSAEYQASYDDATYWFKNAEHRALFVADPDHYAPRFNGFCTVAVSRGIKYEADPEAWAIADGKLWVFGSKGSEGLFREHTADTIAKATENWPGVRQQAVR